MLLCYAMKPEKRNGSAQHDPPFAFIGRQFAVMTRTQILESLAQDAIVQSKTNITAGPLFRLTADNFREWSQVAEPGGVFQAPEVGLRIIRLSAFSPIATSLSEKAQGASNGRMKLSVPDSGLP